MGLPELSDVVLFGNWKVEPSNILAYLRDGSTETGDRS